MAGVGEGGFTSDEAAKSSRSWTVNWGGGATAGVLQRRGWAQESCSVADGLQKTTARRIRAEDMRAKHIAEGLGRARGDKWGAVSDGRRALTLPLAQPGALQTGRAPGGERGPAPAPVPFHRGHCGRHGQRWRLRPPAGQETPRPFAAARPVWWPSPASSQRSCQTSRRAASGEAGPGRRRCPIPRLGPTRSPPWRPPPIVCSAAAAKLRPALRCFSSCRSPGHHQ